MTRFIVDVRVTLRPGLADPEGQTIASALRSLGYGGVSDVRAGKLLQVVLDAPDRGAADRLVSEMCRRLLANPVMETASWTLAPADDPISIEARR